MESAVHPTALTSIVAGVLVIAFKRPDKACSAFSREVSEATKAKGVAALLG
jgi:hypothetical protein